MQIILTLLVAANMTLLGVCLAAYLLTQHKSWKLPAKLTFEPPKWKGKVLKPYDTGFLYNNGESFRSLAISDAPCEKTKERVVGSVLLELYYGGYIKIQKNGQVLKEKDYDGNDPVLRMYMDTLFCKGDTSFEDLRDRRPELMARMMPVAHRWYSRVRPASRWEYFVIAVSPLILFVLGIVFCKVFGVAFPETALLSLAPVTTIAFLFMTSSNFNSYSQEYLVLTSEIEGYREYLMASEHDWVETTYSGGCDRSKAAYAYALGIPQKSTRFMKKFEQIFDEEKRNR